MPKALAGLEDFAGIGSVLAGKYAIDRVVGMGGMGVVVVARHLRLNTRVAIKFLLPRVVDQPKLVARFQREARAASRIAGPHVVRVLDVDVRSDGVPYIVMEFLEGETLQSRLETSGALGLEESVDYVLEAGEALAEAHAAGIAHRDLKPANLFLARGAEHERTIKVLDFGIAKIFESEDADTFSGITASGAFVGSPPYMSPEQLVQPATVDSRTDIWSLGIVLYECLTGSTPFASSGIGQTCARILQEEPIPLASLRPDMPQALEPILRRCLTKSREGRFTTVAELARELAPFGTERAVRSLRVIERAPARSLLTSNSVLEPTASPELSPPGLLSDIETALTEPTVVPPRKTRGRLAWPVAVLLGAVAALVFGELRATRSGGAGAGSSSTLATLIRLSAAQPVASEPRPVASVPPEREAPMPIPAPSSDSPRSSSRRAGKAPARRRPPASGYDADFESVFVERK
jgi:eukaryotic-like serine/threonine-protein kinase